MDEITLVFLVFAIFEGVQVATALLGLYSIRKRLFEILPPGIKADQILSEAVFGFMEGVAKDPKRQEAFFGFCGACAIAAWSQVKDNIMPGSKGIDAIGGAVDKAVSKNPYAAVGVELIKLFGPKLMERMSASEQGKAPRTSGNQKW